MCPACLERPIERGLVMCAGCWVDVPETHKRDLEATWRAYQRKPSELTFAQYQRTYDLCVIAAAGARREDA